MVIQELAERRKQLWDIAVKRLPSGTLSQLGVKPGTLLGYKAAQVYKTLKTKGISTGDIECRQGWLVYEAASLDTDLADRLWDVGFRDVDDVDDQGMTALKKVYKYPRYGPYSAQRSFNMSWLIGKGADTRLSPVICEYTALHFLGAIFGRLSHRPRDPPVQGPSNFEIVMNLIMLDDSRHSCRCYCSPGGCTPLAVFLSELIKTQGAFSYTESIAIDGVVEVLSSLSPKSPGAFERRILPEVLRLLTFKTLGITHTCAHHKVLRSRLSFRPFDPEDAQEIHEEEKDMIQELDYLVLVFTSDYKRLGLPFGEFLREHWCNRIVSKSESLSEEQKHQIQEIGVILEWTVESRLMQGPWIILNDF